MYSAKKNEVGITNPNARKLIIVLFGFIFFGSAVFTSYLAYQQYFIYSYWPAQMATVDAVRTIPMRRSIPSVIADYTYRFNGKEYGGSSQVDNRASIQKSDVISIRVDPQNPADSLVLRSSIGIFYLIWSILIAPFGALLVYIGVRLGH